MGCSEKGKSVMKPKNIRIPFCEGFALKGKIIVITGGAGFIWLHFAEPLVVAAIIHRWKHIDISVNAIMAVGPGFYDNLESYTEEDWDLVMRL